MNEEQTNKPPIGRYILIAFLFVIVFVGASYLIYRFTRSSNNPNSTPTPTPSASSNLPTTSGSGLRYGTVLPAPVIGAINPNDRKFTPPTTPNRPIVRANIPGYSTVAQDGFGNLLFDNLTHSENAALQRARIDADARIRLAQETNKGNLDRLKTQTSATSDQQARELAYKAAIAKQQLDLDLARLENQLAIARLQAQRQPTATNQLALTRLQNEAQQKRSEQQLASQELQAKNNLAQQVLQSATQLALAKNQSETSIISQKNQLSAAKKQEIVRLAYQKAQNEDNLAYSLLARKLASDLARAERFDQNKQTLQQMQLQASIQERLMLLQSYNSPNYWGGYF